MPSDLLIKFLNKCQALEGIFILMENLQEKKKRLNELCEGLPRGGKTRLVRYAGISMAQLWNLCNLPTGWTSAEHEERIWAFFEQGSEITDGEDLPVDQDEIREEDIQDENTEAMAGLAALLEHDNPEIRRHIIKHIKLLTEARFPVTPSEQRTAILRRIQAERKARKLLTQKGAEKTLPKDNKLDPLLADMESQGGKSRDRKKRKDW